MFFIQVYNQVSFTTVMRERQINQPTQREQTDCKEELNIEYTTYLIFEHPSE